MITEKLIDGNDRRRPTTLSRRPTNLLKTHMGKQSRRKTITPTPSLDFQPVPLPPEHMDTKEAKLRQKALDVGAVSKWEVGRRGGRIASRFVRQRRVRRLPRAGAHLGVDRARRLRVPVSYTHLTLPTILLV